MARRLTDAETLTLRNSKLPRVLLITLDCVDGEMMLDPVFADDDLIVTVGDNPNRPSTEWFPIYSGDYCIVDAGEVSFGHDFWIVKLERATPVFGDVCICVTKDVLDILRKYEHGIPDEAEDAVETEDQYREDAVNGGWSSRG